MAARRPGGLNRLLGAGRRAIGRVRMARLLARRIPATPEEYFERLDTRARFHFEGMAAWDLAGIIDVVIYPAFGLPAPHHGATGDLVDALTYTAVANLLGLPAGVVPVTSVGTSEESDRPHSRDPAERVARSAERGSAGLLVAVQVNGRNRAGATGFRVGFGHHCRSPQERSLSLAGQTGRAHDLKGPETKGFT